MDILGVLAVIAALAIFAYAVKRDGNRAAGREVPAELPVVRVPRGGSDAPVSPPPSLPVESVVAAIDDNKFVQYKEVLALGKEWADVWWCANTLPQAGLIDLGDEKTLWSIIGNVGCDPHGIIHYGYGFPRRGFEFRDANGIHNGHLSYSPPGRYEYRQQAPRPYEVLAPVATRATYGFPAPTAEEAYFLDKTVYRARVFDEVKDAFGRVVAFSPVHPEDHGKFIAEQIKARGWSAKRPSGTLGPEWDIKG